MKKYVTGFFMAWGNFFWIPTPCKKWDSEAKSYMLSWLPTIGLFIGLLWVCVYHTCYMLSLPILVDSFLMTLTPFLLSGFMHVDGFMDVCDAMGSKRSIEEKQKILKDSHVGTFAVIKMIFVVLGYFVFLEYGLSKGIDFTNLLLIVIIPRAVSAAMVMLSKPMGVSQYVNMEKHGLWLLIVQTVIYIVLCGIFCENYLQTAIVMAESGLGTFLSILIAKRNLGGMNGDIAGFGIVWGELLGTYALLLF